MTDIKGDLVDCPFCDRFLGCIGLGNDGMADMQCNGKGCGFSAFDVPFQHIEKWYKKKVHQQRDRLTKAQYDAAIELSIWEWMNLDMSTKKLINLRMLY